jgi:hypothetical protein
VFFLKAQSVFACVVLAEYERICSSAMCQDCEDCAAGGKASGIQLRRFIRAVAEVLEFEMKTSEALRLVLGPVGLNAWLMADESVSLFHPFPLLKSHLKSQQSFNQTSCGQ